MNYIIIAILFFILLIIKLLYDEKNGKKRRESLLKKQWGRIPDTEYTYEKLKSLRAYYESCKDSSKDLDDITWNDIAMEQIFMYLNNTSSSVGEEYLYALLRKPLFQEEPLKERDRLITYFMEHEEERIKVQSTLLWIGKLKNISLFEYISRAEDIKTNSKWIHYFCMGSLLLSLLLVLFSGFGILPFHLTVFLLVASVIHNIFQYYRLKARVEAYFNIIIYMLKLLAGVKRLIKLEIPELSSYMSPLKEALLEFSRFKRGSFILIGGKSGSLADILLDYERMLFHSDLIKFHKMVAEVQKNRPALFCIFENVGILDSMIGAGSFRTWLGKYCKPVLVHSKEPMLSGKDLYHPLVEDPVANSLTEKRCVLITGSNASGKSTFIKTIALNAVLSQTIFTSTSSCYEASYFKIFSSMALTDNLLGKESYYIVEIKSLKRILNQAEDKIPTLCFVDEVLRGTNTLERIAASSRILLSLSKKNALCFAATHDIELTHILERYYSNYHFQEEISGNEIQFDYKLYKGRAVSRNAIKLLSMMGYDKEIVDQAVMAANDFMEKGVWNHL